MAGILSVVCTPIGNLEDISRRALRILAEADLILAENVESTLKLLNLLDVPREGTKILSCAQHEEQSRIKVVLERLDEGQRVALLSDAGAPSVSDPGGRIVEAVAATEHRIEVIPGASALVAALMGAGLIANRFAFLGFLPRKGKEREKIISDARKAGLALVIYESPLRAVDTLVDLFKLCGPARVVVARELTKHYETFHRGTLGGVMTPELIEKGEMVIIVEEGELAAVCSSEESEAEAYEKMRVLIDSGAISTKEAARRLAKELSIPSRTAYDRLLSFRA
jgi:16S rRNA (cytidine1402-2'-O)-methyltransferase